MFADKRHLSSGLLTYTYCKYCWLFSDDGFRFHSYSKAFASEFLGKFWRNVFLVLHTEIIEYSYDCQINNYFIYFIIAMNKHLLYCMFEWISLLIFENNIFIFSIYFLYVWHHNLFYLYYKHGGIFNRIIQWYDAHHEMINTRNIV